MRTHRQKRMKRRRTRHKKRVGGNPVKPEDNTADVLEKLLIDLGGDPYSEYNLS